MSGRRDQRKGVVLVTVLWTIALLSALAMAASTTFRGFAGIIAVDRDKARADALLEAGLESSAYILTKLGDAPLSMKETTISLSTGSVRLRLSDDGGRININKAPVKVLASVLRSVGAADDADVIAKSIDAWRVHDQGDRPATPAAAAAAPPVVAAQPATGSSAIPTIAVPTPQAADPAKQAEDEVQSFSNIRQLIEIPGMDVDYLDALAPLTTVFGDDKVNILTASPKVIAALPGISAGQVSAILEARQRVPVAQDRIQKILGPLNDYVRVDGHNIASVELTARLIDGYVAAAHAVVVVLPGDKQPYRVLAWTPLSASARRVVATAGGF